MDVKETDKNLQKMLAASNGLRKVPVIVKGDAVTIGYDGT